jgi:hypothetical protein
MSTTEAASATALTLSAWTRRCWNPAYADLVAGGSEVTSSRPLSSWDAREPCIPWDVGHAGLTKAHGKVTLPLSVYWSGPSDL